MSASDAFLGVVASALLVTMAYVFLGWVGLVICLIGGVFMLLVFMRPESYVWRCVGKTYVLYRNNQGIARVEYDNGQWLPVYWDDQDNKNDLARQDTVDLAMLEIEEALGI